MNKLACAVAVAIAICSAPAQRSLTTTFDSTNNGGWGWSVFFDLYVDIGVQIPAIDIDSDSLRTGTIDVYLTAAGGTHVQRETDPAAWTLVASSLPAPAQPRRTPTHCVLATPLSLQPGTYGVGITYNDYSPRFIDGSRTYANPDMSITTGSVLPGAPGTQGTVYAPRTWSGTIYYTLLPGFATADPFGRGCGPGDPSTFYEVFTGAFDLAGSGFAMRFSDGEYAVLPGGHAALVPPTGTPLVVGVDDTLRVRLPWAMPTANGTTNDVWVNANGWIALESTFLGDGSESIAELAAGPTRVCPLWDDLDPDAGGTVHALRDPTAPQLFHVTFTDVPEELVGGANTFQVTFAANGSIDVKYGTVTVGDCLVGYSRGHGTPIPPAQVDLSDPRLLLVAGNDRPPLSAFNSARPVIGRTAVVRTLDIPASSIGGVILLGGARLQPGIDLSRLGMPGCTLYTSADLGSVPFTPAGAFHDVRIPIGNDPRLAGLHLYVQPAVIAPGTTPLGVSAANALDWTIRSM